MEIRDLYDDNKKLTNETIKKGEKVPKGRYYLTVVVWIENSNNEFLIQKTSKEKGSYYSTTGGHPKSGETSIQGIVTEIKEELGLSINQTDLVLFKTTEFAPSTTTPSDEFDVRLASFTIISAGLYLDISSNSLVKLLESVICVVLKSPVEISHTLNPKNVPTL